MTFLIATTVDDALAALAGGARPIAGGSDLVVGARHGKAALPADLVAIDSDHPALCALSEAQLLDGLCFAASDAVVTRNPFSTK